MKTQTFERFQGLWIGGIVGQALANYQYSGVNTGMLEFPSQNWLRERRQIAQLLLNQGELAAEAAEEVSAIAPPAVNINHQQQLLEELGNREHPLQLLALILVPEAALTWNSADDTSIADIWFWHSLIQFILSCSSENLDLELVVKQLQQALTPNSELLLNLLLLVTRYLEEGTSLHQLQGELVLDAKPQQIAIAYAWYCFLATPQDFKLAVLRATRVDSPLASLTTVLTATLSGAYNGMAGIPLNWRMRVSQHPNYLIEEEVFYELFKTWLGIYDLTSQQELFNPRIDAVASFSTLQPRKTLNLISQQSK